MGAQKSTGCCWLTDSLSHHRSILGSNIFWRHILFFLYFHRIFLQFLLYYFFMEWFLVKANVQWNFLETFIIIIYGMIHIFSCEVLEQMKFLENLDTPSENIWPHFAGDRSKPNPNSSGLFDGVTFKKEADDAQEVCNLSILLQLLSAMSLSTPLWLASCTCCNPHCWFSLLKQLVEKQTETISSDFLPFFIIG